MTTKTEESGLRQSQQRAAKRAAKVARKMQADMLENRKQREAEKSRKQEMKYRDCVETWQRPRNPESETLADPRRFDYPRIGVWVKPLTRIGGNP